MSAERAWHTLQDARVELHVARRARDARLRHQIAYEPVQAVARLAAVGRSVAVQRTRRADDRPHHRRVRVHAAVRTRRGPRMLRKAAGGALLTGARRRIRLKEARAARAAFAAYAHRPRTTRHARGLPTLTVRCAPGGAERARRRTRQRLVGVREARRAPHTAGVQRRPRRTQTVRGVRLHKGWAVQAGRSAARRLIPRDAGVAGGAPRRGRIASRIARSARRASSPRRIGAGGAVDARRTAVSERRTSDRTRDARRATLTVCVGAWHTRITPQRTRRRVPHRAQHARGVPTPLGVGAQRAAMARRGASVRVRAGVAEQALGRGLAKGARWTRRALAVVRAPCARRARHAGPLRGELHTSRAHAARRAGGIGGHVVGARLARHGAVPHRVIPHRARRARRRSDSHELAWWAGGTRIQSRARRTAVLDARCRTSDGRRRVARARFAQTCNLILPRHTRATHARRNERRAWNAEIAHRGALRR